MIPGFAFSMKSGPKNGWHSIVPLCLRSKTAAHFCMFPKVKSAGYGPGNAPVYLNVYDLTPINGYVYWAGIGIFHSGVEGLACKSFLNIFLDDEWQIKCVIRVTISLGLYILALHHCSFASSPGLQMMVLVSKLVKHAMYP